ncbi:amino acid ABC transporter permease [Acholeplasma hippikon]|nr:amino acid ABC transporter permease [Acholeplasma hippikon]
MIEIIREYGTAILASIGITLLLAVVGTIGGAIVSLVLVDMRTQKVDKRRDHVFVKIVKTIAKWFSTAYITVFRGTPMIIQAYVLFYGLSPVFRSELWTPLLAGLIIVTLNTAAYIAEVIRGNVNSLDIGQMEAARSLGFSRRQALTKFIYPQAIKNALPSIGNEFIVNLKDTAVLSVIGVADLFFTTRQIFGKTYDVINTFMLAAIIYLIMTSLTSLLVNRLEKRGKGVKRNA